MGIRQVPAIGRIVHYRLPTGPSAGQYRPAIIVRVWTPGNPDSAVNLHVFTDESNDRLPAPVWATSVFPGDANGQYVWPPYVPPASTDEAAFLYDK